MKPIEELSGRELDADVAEGVMGWTHQAGFSQPWSKDGGDTGTPLPHYSSDVAAAWEVVERLQGLGFHVSISKPPDMRTWDVRGWNEETGVRFIAHADTAPEAICRAALKAIRSIDD